eukprot:547100_1
MIIGKIFYRSMNDDLSQSNEKAMLPKHNIQNHNSIYMIGDNKHPGLDLSHGIGIIRLPDKQNVKQINCGKYYTIFTDNNNQFWVVGDNDYGQCGVWWHNYDVNVCEKTRDIFQCKGINEKRVVIRKVCTNVAGSCTFWISNENKLYGNGRHYKGCQLGIKRTWKHINYINKPEFINLKHVTDVQSADRYCMVLCRGINKDIAIMIVTNLSKLYQILIPNDIINLMIMFIEMIKNEVYTTYTPHSRGDHGWQRIESLTCKQIIQIRCGHSHSLCLESNGTLWCSGKHNNYGQLGLGYEYLEYKDMTTKQIPYFLNNKIKIKDIQIGCEHNLVTDYNCNIYSWGYNYFGQCGFGTTDDIFIPKK